MPSKARQAFDDNVKDVERLFEIHENLGSTRRGHKHRLEVLNKPAIVLMPSPA